MNKELLTPDAYRSSDEFRSAMVRLPSYHHALSQHNITNWYSELHYHLHWMCPFSCALLTVGFFTNVLSIGVFKHKTFDFMKLPGFIIIACALNMLFLIVITIKIFSCILDHVTDANGKLDNSRYTICIYVGWVYDVLEYVADINLLFAVYNRLKSQSAHDLTSTMLNARRVPIISLMATSVLAIVPASLYHELKISALEKRSNHRCSDLFVFPYDHSSTIDVVIASVHITSVVAIGLLLIILCARIGWNFVKLKRRKMSRKSAWLTSAMDVTGVSSSSDDSMGFDLPGIEDINIKPESVFKDIHLSRIFVSERDESMTKLTVLLALSHVVANLSKHVVKYWNDTSRSHHGHLHSQVAAAVIVESLSMTYHASNVVLFMVSSKIIRGLIRQFFFERPPHKHYYTDMALARRMDVIRSYRDEVMDPEEEARMDTYLIETFNVTRARLNLEDVVPSRTMGKSRGDKILVRRRKFKDPNTTTWL